VNDLINIGLVRAVRIAAEKARERKWDKLTIAVDWHDTIARSNYSADGAYDLYDTALEALKWLSNQPHVVLVLYTSSYMSVVEKFRRWMQKEHGVKFDFFNCNPNVKNTKYGDFGKKFYYDVMIDDKAGFDPEKEWDVLVWAVNYFKEHWNA
jgi:hypothetical protein